jgi:NADH-quinone oxidoreductase subunit M
MLWMFQRVYYGKVTNGENATLPDLMPHEWSSVVPLCAVALVMGIFPAIFLKPMEPAVTRIVDRMQNVQTLRVERERIERERSERTERFERSERVQRLLRAER